MVAGLAPGRAACTWMVGKSTWGRSLTDSARYAMMPNRAIPSINRLVAMGRRMNGSETFIGYRVYHLAPPQSNLFQGAERRAERPRLAAAGSAHLGDVRLR
jgi:hypothetical protein